MAQAFTELGHEVTVFCGPGDDVTADMDDMEVFGFAPDFRTHVPSRRVHRGQSYLHAVRVARMVVRDPYGLVYSRSLRSCLLPALRGVPTVYEAHTLGVVTGRQDRAVLERLLRAPGFRGIVAISTPLADDLAKRCAVDPSRILVAHDAVRAPDVAPTVRHAGQDRFTVGYTGSLFPGKGAENLLRIAADCPWADFVIVGGPADRARALALECDQRGLENVRVLEPIGPSASRRLQQSCDVLVAPFSRRVESDSGDDIARWTSPMKIFEYMVSGRPMVVSDLPVLREVLRPDVDALIVPPEDPDALIAALTLLREDASLGERLAASASERALAEHTWLVRADRILRRFVPEAA